MDTKSAKPGVGNWNQQTLRAWSPVMTPLKAIVLFLAVGAAFIPTGLYLLNSMGSMWQKTIVYDSTSNMDVSCSISTKDAKQLCTYSTTLDRDVTGPIYVYYELGNFFQNHRRYSQNLYFEQLKGVVSLHCIALQVN